MAIVTSKFRTQAASSFATAFTLNNIYMMLGRPQSWDNSLSTNFASQASGTPTDTNPPNPADNAINEYAMWRDAMAAIKVSGSDVRLATARNNWITGTRYDMYRHDISSAQASANGKYSLDDTNMIVYNTSNGAVYKCLYNGADPSTSIGIVSTVPPTSTTTAAFATADGYVWKYLYSISASDADFITANYIPIPNSGSNVSNVNGIDVILVTNGGAGYGATPSVTIYGDGSGATAEATTSGGAVTGINMINKGAGYTWAKIVFGGSPSAAASATAIIAPTGGHGANFATECMAHNVMIAATVSGYAGTDVPINQDFRTIGLVANPCIYTTSAVTSAGTLFTGSTAHIMRTLTMTSSATTAPAYDIQLSDTNGATGLAVFQSSGTVVLDYIQPVNSDVPTPPTAADLTTGGRYDTTTKQLRQFVDGTTITGTGYSQAISSTTTVMPEIQPYSGNLLYLDYRQPVTRSSGQNEKINIVINF